MKTALWFGLLAACTGSVDGQPVTPDAPEADAFIDPRGRVTFGLVGIWEFDDMGGAGGNLITDSSGITPLVQPTITLNGGTVSWLPTSLRIESPVSIRTPVEVNRMIEKCARANACTLEAWVTTPSNTQIGIGTPPEPARIVSFAPENGGTHHISIGQLNGEWVAQVRNANPMTEPHGGVGLRAPSMIGQSTHLVITTDMTTRKLYVDGVLAAEDALGGALMGVWNANRALVLAGEPNGNGGWVGTFHLVAMYERALDATEVMTNRMAGP
jgi:hypothetical protein